MSMSGRPGRRMQSGFSSGSQHDIRVVKKRENVRDISLFSQEDDRDRGYGGGGGDSKGRNEEVRISRLTRLLARLDTEESFFTISGQIESALNETENRRYVSRCFQCLCPSFHEVFKGLTGLPWEASGSKRYAQLLAKICRAMDNQSTKFFQWIVEIIIRTSRGSPNQISSSAYVMECVSINLMNLIDSNDIITFVRCVYDMLEDVGNPRIFLVLGNIFVCGTDLTTATWRNPHFHDFIDMVVGWMVDVQQSNGQFTGCAELLEKSKNQFMKDLGFLVTLMGQILEDLEQAIKKVQPTSDSNSAEFQKVLQLMRAFTSMLALECPLDKLVITEFCDRLVSSTLQFIRMCEPHQNMDRNYRYDLLSTVNQALFFSGGVLSQSITKYFRAQLKLGATNLSYIKWPKLYLISFLESITVWIETAVSQTQLQEDIVEICGTLQNLLDDMQKSLPSHDQHYVLNLVIALLRTRNVNLLQQVYAWLISKLPTGRKETAESIEDDESCLFVLAGLTDIISNKSSSILSLWALQPAMFELLVDVTNMNVHKRTQFCTLELLKIHCTMHSHFVSSIASTGSFNTDSPGSRFLPALMEFWLSKLKSLCEPEKKWLTEWIFEFLQSTNSYSSLIYELKPDFFHQFVQLITHESVLLTVGAKILEWFCEDPGYMQLESLNEVIRERVIFLILDENLPDRVKVCYKRLMYQMPCVLLIPDDIFSEDCVETDMSYEFEEDDLSLVLTSTEFNLFLYELLIGNAQQLPQFSFSSKCASGILHAAADHLIRLKLKTPLGKPQDFFAQLLMVLKRSRASKTPLPVWKLHFVFELEKKFQLWTHGSALDDTVLTEHVKQFYSMNKSPFLEWLKRIRSEIIETCLLSREYPLAYFNAALIGNSQKMEHVLFYTNDHIGLKGMGNLAGYYYLNGRYEDALKLLMVENDHPNGLSDEIKKLSNEMLQDSLTALQQWQTPKETKVQSADTITSQLQNSSLKNLVDLQLTSKSKVDLSIINDLELLETLKLPTLQKLHILHKHSSADQPQVNSSAMETFERTRMDKMLEAGNMEYVAKWLTDRDIDVNRILSDEDLSSLSLSSIPVATLKVCADFYAKKPDNKKSVILYNILRELVTGSMDSDLASKITCSLSARIMESDDFFTIFSAESLNHCDRQETIKALHQVALQSFPESSNAWLAYGDFAYSRNEKNGSQSPTENFMKYTAVECYTKYIQLSQKQPQSTSNAVSSNFVPYTPKVIVMTRLLQLFREGFTFNLEETINSPQWLILLAEMSQIPEMHAYLIEKYPEQVGLFFTSHDAKRVLNKVTPRRRNLFDLSPYSYVDTSEEPLSSTLVLNNLSQLEKISGENADAVSQPQLEFKFRSDIDLPASVTVFAQELLRLASSMEDMWVWALERIAIDWGRRLAYLKKECTRSSSAEKIQTYVQPIITYFEALLENTTQSENPVDINFINRHKLDIQKHLESISSSCTLEDVYASMNSLMKYSARFGMLVNNRLPLQLFSTKLSKSDFYDSSSFSLCLPGQPPHLKICNLHPVVHALPTKTKPKRIRMLATNGKFYDYLVKGTENLNIDCGVMQFLKVTQSFFKHTTRTYSVTPLGKRGGLIQIVPDAVPLFTLYKKHLQRNKCLEKTSEMFWRRMNSIGFEDRSSLTALREVYESLSSETSGDLITRELLLSAATPAQWMDSVQTFTKDCSVGSAIGYLLGIGDRHLDNMLVNVARGKFIHVDFTIIFGRGATLRVPEKVPFRLTQNLRRVLQYPGPSGVFHVVMQDTLSSFQVFKETAKHLIKNIAFSQMFDEDSPVDLTKILLSEVDSAVRLFMCRSSQYLSLLQAIRNEILNILDNIDIVRKLSRKMNRWRRMLVNLNTVLQFISSVTQPSGPYEKVVSLVQNEWTNLFQTSLEMGIEQLAPSTNSFLASIDDTEKIVKQLQEALAETDCGWNKDMLKLQDANIQVIDLNKLEVLVKYAEMNILTYNPSTTTQKLIEEATSIDNLSQMYEGWTAWV